ncbi:hypothetical protein [Streptomyces sp. NPDC047079]
MTDTVLRTPAAGRLFSRPAAAASCVGYVLTGMLQALYGSVSSVSSPIS